MPPGTSQPKSLAADRDTQAILDPKAIGRKFMLWRSDPRPGLRASIQDYWTGTWNLPSGRTYRTETLPFPAVHLALEVNGPEGLRVGTRKFSRLLRRCGRVFGVKIRPAMLHPLLGGPVSRLTDRRGGLAAVCGVEGGGRRARILGEARDEECVAYLEQFPCGRLPDRNSKALADVRDAVEGIATARSIIRAEHVSTRLGSSIRSTQDACDKYVGVSPKWCSIDIVRRRRTRSSPRLFRSTPLHPRLQGRDWADAGPMREDLQKHEERKSGATLIFGLGSIRRLGNASAVSRATITCRRAAPAALKGRGRILLRGASGLVIGVASVATELVRVPRHWGTTFGPRSGCCNSLKDIETQPQRDPSYGDPHLRAGVLVAPDPHAPN